MPLQVGGHDRGRGEIDLHANGKFLDFSEPDKVITARCTPGIIRLSLHHQGPDAAHVDP